MTEPDTTTILVAIAEVKGELAGVRQRIDAIEVARSVARHDQEDWKDEVREQLHELVEQTKTTNGKVQAHAILFAELRGAARVFRWWPGAVAGAIVAVIAYFLANA